MQELLSERLKGFYKCTPIELCSKLFDRGRKQKSVGSIGDLVKTIEIMGLLSRYDRQDIGTLEKYVRVAREMSEYAHGRPAIEALSFADRTIDQLFLKLDDQSEKREGLLRLKRYILEDLDGKKEEHRDRINSALRMLENVGRGEAPGWSLQDFYEHIAERYHLTIEDLNVTEQAVEAAFEVEEFLSPIRELVYSDESQDQETLSGIFERYRDGARKYTDVVRGQVEEYRRRALGKPALDI